MIKASLLIPEEPAENVDLSSPEEEEEEEVPRPSDVDRLAGEFGELNVDRVCYLPKMLGGDSTGSFEDNLAEYQWEIIPSQTAAAVHKVT